MNFINKFVIKEYIILINNIFFSGFFQLVTYIFPIIITPYLIKTVGINNFGLISFATVFFTYLYSITDYGFMVTGNREVALNKDYPSVLSKILANIICAKLILCCFSFLLLLFSFMLITKIGDNYKLFLAGFTIVIGRVLMPNWFFQGLEEMKALSIINLLSQFFFIFFIFLFIKSDEDYTLVLFIQGISYLVAGLLGLLWIIRKYLKIQFIRADFKGILYQLHTSFPVFIISLSSISYNNANTFMLGLYANNDMVGYYSIADKVTTLIKQCIGALGISLLPYISRLTNRGLKSILIFFRQFYSFVILSIFVLTIIICFFSKDIIYLLLGHFQIEAEKALFSLSLVLDIIIINSIPYIILLAYGRHKQISIIMSVGCLINLIFNFLLIPLFQINGAIISIYLTEVFISIGYIVIFRKLYLKKLSL
jgi:PST family polysaccharide transporter